MKELCYHCKQIKARITFKGDYYCIRCFYKLYPEIKNKGLKGGKTQNGYT